MTKVSSEQIKELRNLTQAGMKDCKDALQEADGDLQKAVDIVKAKGLNVVSGREGKIASEGAVMVSQGGPCDSVALVEVNCQTDFVAKSHNFLSFVNKTVDVLYEKTVAGETFTAAAVESERQSLVSTTKENVVVRRWWFEEVGNSNAKVFTYVHSNYKIGVLLTLLAPSESATADSSFRELGNDLAMQVAAMSPLAVSSAHLDPAEVERQRAIFEAQLTELNKPQAAWAKILEGKFNKWYTDVCLLNQESVVHPKTTISQVIKNVGDKLGGEIQVVNLIRCQVGEGIEVKKENLADEVSKLTGTKS